ncbi:hypothetical protein DAPPUDRAFT_248054 [Daphnia pulex]|uniref:Uncharacterized protein n=1 Tax=Daphnia pulex TaxID=6669 RepID=E9GTK5_DAPPU|nr:hypothetical protein DAPPUDRAFT_248054 [Daphnia pulex]|eukprot:EFX77097.1 hypothetical protein DAPPUDRAFT_248054 [Daphnia pulex]
MYAILDSVIMLGQLVFYSFDSDAKEEWPQSGGWIRHIICLDHNNKESTQEKVSRTPKVDMAVAPQSPSPSWLKPRVAQHQALAQIIKIAESLNCVNSNFKKRRREGALYCAT